jgi:hypothetical protein
MPALLARPPARFWRLTLTEPNAAVDRNRRREQVLDTLARHGLELLEAERVAPGRSTLYVAAAHRIPWHVAAAAAAAVPGYVDDTLEGAGA